MTETRSIVVEWKMHCTRDFHRSKLQKGEKERCLSAIQQFQTDCKRSSLNLEFLGHPPNENHYSIRASKELRIILALDWERHICVLANMGHHDAMYNWSDRQRRYTDPTEAIDLNRNTTPGSSIDEQIRALSNFEEWMLFLHPTQRPLVERRYAGAARIRGAAGTGKTVVALHRAAALGRRYSKERVLFTSFSRSLCNRFEETFRQLPDAPPTSTSATLTRSPTTIWEEDNGLTQGPSMMGLKQPISVSCRVLRLGISTANTFVRRSRKSSRAATRPGKYISILIALSGWDASVRSTRACERRVGDLPRLGTGSYASGRLQTIPTG